MGETMRTIALHAQCHACTERVWPTSTWSTLADLWTALEHRGWRRRAVPGGTTYACPQHPFDEEVAS